MLEAGQTLSGRIAYLGVDGKQNGVERFSIAKMPGGALSLNAACEIWEDGLLRHCILTLDAHERPQSAYVQTFEQGISQGASSYSFGKAGASCFQLGQSEGARMDRPLDFFGTHALINDGWIAKALPDGQDAVELDAMATCSYQANGGGAPGLLPTKAHIKRGALSDIALPCGTFNVRHYQVTYGDFPPLDMWVCENTHVLVRMTWDYTGDAFQLDALTQSLSQA